MGAGKGGYAQDEQLGRWRAYVAWEASNGQRLDPAALAARVILAHEQVRAAGVYVNTQNVEQHLALIAS